jgi:hypothetical protein
MQLDQFIKSHTRELVTTRNFRGIDVDIEYGDKARISQMLNKSKRIEYRQHQPTEEYNDDAFLRQLARCVHGWRGLTLGKLRDITNVELTDEDDPAFEIPCTPENVFVLFKTAYGFDTFVRDTVVDISVFREHQHDMQKKT